MKKWWENLPKRKGLAVKSGSIYLVKQNKWRQVCRVDEGESAFYAKYSQMLNPQKGSLSDVFDQYIDHALTRLKPATQREYKRIIENILRPAYGHMAPDDVQSSDIGAHLEHRYKQGKAVMGNREMAVFGAVFQYAIRIRLCNYSPTRGVRRNTERPRTKHIEHDELRATLDRAPVQVMHMIAAAYLTGLRQKDLIDMTKEQVTPDGLVVLQSKDGKRELREWSDTLRFIVREALERTECEQVFTNSYGRPWTQSGFQSAMKRLDASFTFHDIRGKAETDHPEGYGLLSRYKKVNKVKAIG